MAEIQESSVFTGFILRNPVTEDEYDSKNLGLYRVSNNNRYSETVTPTFEDKIVHVPGQQGSYYFGTKYKDKPIAVQVAFDHLTIDQLNEITQIFEDLVMQDEPLPLQLIFDETPYKMNLVYLQNAPTFSYVPFDEGGETVLKGEGTINFICYEPFARSVSQYCYLNDTGAVNDAKRRLGIQKKGEGVFTDIAKPYPLTNRVKWKDYAYWEELTTDGTKSAIINLGDYDIYPLIIINTSGITLNSTERLRIQGYNSETHKYEYLFYVPKPQSGQKIYIDCANGRAYDENMNDLEITYDYTTNKDKASSNIRIPSVYQKIVSESNQLLKDEIIDSDDYRQIRNGILQKYVYLIELHKEESYTDNLNNKMTLIYDYLYM